MNLIRQLPADSCLQRKLAGPMAPWDLHALLLRRLDLGIQSGNWQRGGGKGTKPKAIELPDSKGRGQKPKTAAVGADVAQRLLNLGLIPPGGNQPTPEPSPLPQFAEQVPIEM